MSARPSPTVVTTVEELRRVVREELSSAVTGPRLLKKTEAARYLSISGRSLDELVRMGDLRRIDLCGPKFDVRDLDTLVSRRAT